MNSITYIDLLRMLKDNIAPSTVYYGGKTYNMLDTYKSYYNPDMGFLSSQNSDTDWAKLGDVILWRSEVLDEVDAKYLKAVLKPLRHRFKFLTIRSSECSDEEQMIIAFNTMGHTNIGRLQFPAFTKGRCYPYLRRNHMYQSLEELGLTNWDD